MSINNSNLRFKGKCRVSGAFVLSIFKSSPVKSVTSSDEGEVLDNGRYMGHSVGRSAYIIPSLVLLVGLLFPPMALGQSAVIASGGDSFQGDGSFSFSVGLPNFSYFVSDNGYVTEGVQHGYEISRIAPYIGSKVTIDAIVYPNPTADKVSLEILDIDLSDLSYALFDIRGRLFQKGQITSSLSTISLETVEPATYFIQIMKNKKSITGFKIVKR